MAIIYSNIYTKGSKLPSSFAVHQLVRVFFLIKKNQRFVTNLPGSSPAALSVSFMVTTGVRALQDSLLLFVRLADKDSRFTILLWTYFTVMCVLTTNWCDSSGFSCISRSFQVSSGILFEVFHRFQIAMQQL